MVPALSLAMAMIVTLSPATAREPEAPDPFQKQVLPLLERYCVDCHMKESSEAGIVLDRFDNQAAAVKDGRTWLRVRDALQGRIMPPADMPQPSLDELDRIIAWIENDFLAAQCAKQVSSAPVVIRRLNRQEYNNTIRDLLGLDLHLADALPARMISGSVSTTSVPRSTSHPSMSRSISTPPSWPCRRRSSCPTPRNTRPPS